MVVHELDVATARRIAVAAQLLTADRPDDVVEVVTDLHTVVVDPTSAVAPNADLVLWSRIGSGYDTGALVRALEVDRTVFEYSGLLRPIDDLPLLRAAMADVPRSASTRAWLEANDGFRGDVLARLRAEGPLRTRDIPDTAQQSWKSTGWTNDKNVSQVLEMLAAQGVIAISRREGRERIWDLAERVYPPELLEGEPIPREEADRERDARRLAALGIARAKGTAMPAEPNIVGDAGAWAVVDGLKGAWRVDPLALERASDPDWFAGRVAIISPLDRLVYDRKRQLDLFDFDFTLEMYKPAKDRRWGFFALPILREERLIGKVDATADRKAGALVVHAIHEDSPFDDASLEAVHAELDDLAAWLGLERLG